MRVSPKSIFFGLVAFGLPFAVTMGWTLGESKVIVPPSAIAPAGAGGMGAAPSRAATIEPVTPVDYGSQPPRLTGPVPSAPSRAGASRPPSSSAPSRSGPPLLSLTDPPVPTPTANPSAPPSPSPTPSSSGAPGLDLIR